MDRFWSKVRKTKSCWLWTAAQRSSGYGAVSIEGKMESAHRLSWMLINGPIPTDKWVLHKCDTPFCVNPDHLFLGSPRENALDMQRKGRKAKVTWLGGTKKELPPGLVPLLGKIYDSKVSKLSGLNPKTVRRIREELGIPALTYREGRKFNVIAGND